MTAAGIASNPPPAGVDNVTLEQVGNTIQVKRPPILQTATGSYAGSSSVDKSVTGLGFPPKLIFFVVTNNKSLTGMAIQSTIAQAFDTGQTAACTFDADGFTVTQGTAFNFAGNTHYWTAVG